MRAVRGYQRTAPSGPSARALQCGHVHGLRPPCHLERERRAGLARCSCRVAHPSSPQGRERGAAGRRDGRLHHWPERQLWEPAEPRSGPSRAGQSPSRCCCRAAGSRHKRPAPRPESRRGSQPLITRGMPRRPLKGSPDMGEGDRDEAGAVYRRGPRCRRRWRSAKSPCASASRRRVTKEIAPRMSLLTRVSAPNRAAARLGGARWRRPRPRPIT
jgi:hypothetical protein